MKIKPLIEAIYDPLCPLPEDPEFYARVIEEPDTRAVSSQIYSLLKERGRLSETPASFRDWLESHYREALFLNLFIKNEMDRILSSFEESRLPVIPLKGVCFAEAYFGHAGARATTDIDLLVRKEDIERAVSLVKALGFHIEQEPIPSHFHISLSRPLPGSRIPLTVELHWNIVKETTSSFPIESVWQEAVPLKEYSYVRQMSDYHAFYMICLHGWRHNLDSAKYYLDIIQLICTRKDRLDFGRLFKESAAHFTRKRLIRTLSIVYETYPFLNRVIELPHRRKLRLSAKYADFVDYQFLSYDSIRHSWSELYDWLTPRKNK